MKKHLGLTTEEVKESRKLHGSNKLAEIETDTFWDKLIGNLEDPIIRILIVALLINVVAAIFGFSSWLDSIGIAFAVTLATGIATWAEYSNESSFKKLQAEASQIMCKVFRNGEVQNIMIDDLVKGDLIVLQTGDMIPGDGKLIEGTLSVDQASLNGESKEAKKYIAEKVEDVDYRDTFNNFALFRGTVVTDGEAVLELENVGEKSLYGEMMSELTVEEIPSPLKEKLQRVADMIAKIGMCLGALTFVAIMFQNIAINNNFDTSLMIAYMTDWTTFGLDSLNAAIMGIILIVVAVPEGLPLLIAMVLSLNMKKMLNVKVLVKTLPGIETAGNLNILFSDKTGTISQGVLSVVTTILGDGTEYDAYSALPKSYKKHMHTAITQNTSSMVSNKKGKVEIIGGNATDKALLGYVNIMDAFYENINKIDTVPFSSARKFSAVTVDGEVKKTYLKGAAEKLLQNCTFTYNKDGFVSELTATDINALNNKIEELANRAIRVLVLAETNELITEDAIPQELTLIGVVGIRDDVRPEAITAIKEVQDAGIQVCMITGDHKSTAIAISKEAGILTKDTDMVLTSSELNEKTDDEVKKMLPNLKVVSRALPTDKSRLVRLSQELKLVVGMTGDGANDAPALKRADVGFAMGITGTEVSKEAADIVLLDDNFASIANAVLYGRTIYHSIQKFIQFQLTLNVAACLLVLLAPLFGMDAPLTIIQMLWVNLVMDALGSPAFGSEPALKEYMKEKPKKRSDSLITKQMLIAVLTAGLSLTGLSLWFLNSDTVLGWFTTEAHRYTAFFAFFILFAVVNGFNVRTTSLNIFNNITKNKLYLKIMGLIVVIQVCMLYIGGDILRTVPLSLRELSIVFLLALVALPIGFARKLITGVHKQ